MLLPFVIFSLPRSRTYWISRFLNYGPWACGHDEIAHVRALDDVRSWLAQPYTGTVETGAAPFWRLVSQYAPQARIVTVRRDQRHVLQSLKATGLDFDERVMAAVLAMHDRKLDQVERRLPGVMRIRYEDLAREETCAALFEHCLGLPHDHDWWAAMAALNLQQNLHHTVRYYAAYQPQLDRATRQAKQAMLTVFSRRRAKLDGVQFRVEPIASMFPEMAALASEHLTEIGADPQEYWAVNQPLLERLEAVDAFQAMSARSNGRLFGYLFTVIGPALEDNTKRVAVHNAFFASPLIPGLGAKLQRAANAELMKRGVDEVEMRAGIRGDGPRLGALYKRMGAEEFGQLYRLRLNGGA